MFLLPAELQLRIFAECSRAERELRDPGLAELDCPGIMMKFIFTSIISNHVHPVGIGKTYRLRWGLPDPGGDDEESRMAAFRSVREELLKKFKVMSG